MTAPQTTRRFVPIFVRRLRLVDFGPIAHRTLELEPGLTVLVGDNNVGKSTILRALHLGLNAGRPSRTDIRVEQSAVGTGLRPFAMVDLEVELSGSPDTHPVESEREVLERVATTLGTSLLGGRSAVIRTLVWPAKSGEDDDVEGSRKFLQEWPESVHRHDLQAAKDAGRAEAGPTLNRLFQVFTLDAARDLASDIASSRSDWGRLLSDPGVAEPRRVDLENRARMFSLEVRAASAPLAAAEKELGELANHFQSAVTSADVVTVIPDIRTLVRSAEPRVSDSVGPLMPIRTQGAGIRSAAAVLGFKARAAQRSVDELRVPVMLMEEPETHLHPLAQRSMARLLEQLDGQVIVTTHAAPIATELAGGARPFAALRLLTPLQPEVPKVGVDVKGQHAKILRFIRANQGECFFARSSVVVEGETERVGLPEFADAYFGEFDALAKRGFAVVAVNGKGLAQPTAELLGSIGLRSISLVDRDNDAGAETEFNAWSEPDWEGALVANDERLKALVAWRGADVVKYSDQQVADATLQLASDKLTEDQWKKQEQRQAFWGSADQALRVAAFLRLRYKNEQAAEVVAALLAGISDELRPGEERIGVVFPPAVLKVLRFLESKP